MKKTSSNSLKVPNNKVEIYFLCLLLLAIPLILFYRVATFEFLAHDDVPFIVLNPNIQHGFTKEAVSWAATAGLTDLSRSIDYWQPMTALSRVLDMQLFGLNPGGHHLINLCYHLLNVFLVFAIFFDLTGCLWRSFFIALLFGIHPVQVETVAWIVSRKDLLSTFFALLTIRSYVEYARNSKLRDSLIAIFFFLLALLSKPSMTSLPLLLVALDFWPLKRIEDGKSLVKVLFEKWPFFICSALMALTPFLRMPSVLRYAPLHDIVSIGIIQYVWHLTHILYPSQLHLYEATYTEFPIWMVLVALGFLVMLVFFAFRQWSKRPYFLIGGLWFVIGLGPAVVIPDPANRFLYFPGIGIFIVFVWFAAEIMKKNRYDLVAIPTMTVVVVGVLCWKTWTYLPVWANTYELFSYSASLGSSFSVHNDLGWLLAERGEKDKASEQFDEAKNIKDACLKLANLVNPGKDNTPQCGKLDIEEVRIPIKRLMGTSLKPRRSILPMGARVY